MSRRLIHLALLVFISIPVHAADKSVWDKSTESYEGKKQITVYRSPTCGCCSKWIAHLEKHGFEITDIKTSAMNSIKQKYAVPPQMASCHTAIIDGYIIEGHVPADDIKRLLKTRPDIAGLSVPQMPVGTPGMEQGTRKDPFSVVQFDKKGEYRSFRDYLNY